MKKSWIFLFLFVVLGIIFLQGFAGAKTFQRSPNVYSIYTINPQFTNGTFFVKYNSVIDIEKIILYYGNGKIIEQAERTDCECGRNRQCSFEIDLEKYQDQEIKYYLDVIDKNGNIGSSIQKSVKVDTIPPVITNPDFMVQIDKNFAIFNIHVDDENFDRIEYIEDSVFAKPKILCRNCKKNCGCLVKKMFRKEDYNFIITVFDKAGNSVSEDLRFSVV